MISHTDIPAKFSLTKNLISDQTFIDLREIYTTGSGDFDVSNGYGVGTGTSSVGIIVLAGGFEDQQVTATMRAVAASDRMGVFARATRTDSGNEYYYYADIDNGKAKLQKLVNSATPSNLVAEQNFVFPTGADIVVTLSCVGALISASFQCATVAGDNGVVGAPLTMSAAEDAVNLPRRGTMGWRTHLKPGWCRSITAEQL
jgi:hypothetical protein